MKPRCQIYLVPGFFGFTALGAYNYFYRVSDFLEAYLLERHGIEAQIVRCRTQPTSSIRRRALAILEEVEKARGFEADSIHFVGHSTGGLDVRLLVAPEVRLRKDRVEPSVGQKTRSVTFVSTPHFGTPLASFFTTLQGRHVLQLLTTLASNRAGRNSIFWTSQALSLVAKMDNWVGRKNTFLDHLVEKLFQHVTLDPNDPIWSFLEEIKNDQGAIIQLTPEGMHLYNAAVADRPGVDYRCLVTTTPRPSRLQLSRKMNSPYRGGSAMLYYLLHILTGREHKHYPYPSPIDSMKEDLERLLPYSVTSSCNDGVAPTMSQLYGELIDVVEADHLDIVGQFDRRSEELYTDWLISGADFNNESFERAWKKVGDKIAESELRNSSMVV